MSLFSQISARFFNARPASNRFELNDLNTGKKAKQARATEPRAQHSASAKFSITSLFDRISSSLSGLLSSPRVEAPTSAKESEKSFASTVSKTLDELAAAGEYKNAQQIVASLKTLQRLDCGEPGKLDDALKAHLLNKSKHKSGRCNGLQVLLHMGSLAEANPSTIRKAPAPGSDETLNQFHADLMRRIEEQYGAAFDRD